ncbi:hypothetical protein AVEN_32641-1 [Araneus ventricosus]|uniref:Uncharacterized protein n=1 Tax=Araneus ventricosus TaxID=182803 RepID=A0A4Y2CAD4_ARAVE|nr:hypothetical protein AVEN_32641-1 [Araneus ventricosus]
MVSYGNLEKEMPAQVLSSSSDRCSKLRGPSQNSPGVASKRDVDITKLSSRDQRKILISQVPVYLKKRILDLVSNHIITSTSLHPSCSLRHCGSHHGSGSVSRRLLEQRRVPLCLQLRCSPSDLFVEVNESQQMTTGRYRPRFD